MDITQLGTQLLSEKLGVSASPETIKQAMSSLLGDGQGNIDLQGMATKMASNGDLSAIVNSWLGDGGNSPISADALLGLLGENQVSDFAGKLGTDTSSAAAGLAEVLPQLMDQGSSGGSLLEAAGGLGGVMGAAKSLFS
ncbi:MAG: DUF937 domain-containing protein [Halieaceae bacterium]|nr:DUF937 domain-containing protein [Halieaceae bacterium]